MRACVRVLHVCKGVACKGVVHVCKGVACMCV